MERGVSSSQSSTNAGDPKYKLVCVDWCPSVDSREGSNARAAALSCVSADTATVGVRVQLNLWSAYIGLE
jgi:hypothetical protein